MLRQDEIAEEYEVSGKEVLTPNGWKPIKTVYKTVPLPVWELRTEKHALRCSGHHLVRSVGEWVHVRNLEPGDIVDTDSGKEFVKHCAPTGETQALYDLTVDDPHHSFYSNGIVSHNSTTFAARMLTLSHIINKYKTLYITPQPAQKTTFGDRLLDMESIFRENLGAQNKYSKRYRTGSTIRMEHCLTSANSVRGMTIDCLLVDEIQGMDPGILPEVRYTTSDSPMPMTIYSGTALTIDTLLEQKWQESSMGCWHVKAGDGKTWLNLYDKDTLEAVTDHPEYPICPITKKKLNVIDGMYVHQDRKALELGNIGFHVPQPMLPDFAYNPLKWAELYSHRKNDSLTKRCQECYGIAVAQGTREITEQDLMYLCVLKDTPEQLLMKTKNGYYRLIVSGCDWGGSDYNPATKTKTSYTVHCILGVAPDGGTDILHYKRYAGMDYKKIASDIIRNHKLWNGMVLASDFGVGFTYNMELRNYIEFDRHFIMNYTGPDKEPIKENKSGLPNQLSVNRTEAVTNVFNDVKSIIPVIRAQDWKISREYLTDWLNMYRIPVELTNGTKTFKYQREATKPDDALHAFTFAYVLVKFYQGKSLVQDRSLENRMRAVMRSPQLAAQIYARNMRDLSNTDYIGSIPR